MADDADDDELENEDAEADGGDGEEDEGEDGAKKRDIKKLAILVGLPVVILLLAGTAGALFFFGGGGEESEVASAEGEHGESGEGDAHAGPDVAPYTFDGPLLVNIVTADGGTAMLSMEIAIEVDDESLYEVLDAHMEVIMDQYTGFVRELRPEDLEGSAGWHRLKLELMRRTNLAIAPQEIEDVLITNLAVQQ